MLAAILLCALRLMSVSFSGFPVNLDYRIFQPPVKMDMIFTYNPFKNLNIQAVTNLT